MLQHISPLVWVLERGPCLSGHAVMTALPNLVFVFCKANHETWTQPDIFHFENPFFHCVRRFCVINQHVFRVSFVVADGCMHGVLAAATIDIPCKKGGIKTLMLMELGQSRTEAIRKVTRFFVLFSSIVTYYVSQHVPSIF